MSGTRVEVHFHTRILLRFYSGLLPAALYEAIHTNKRELLLLARTAGVHVEKELFQTRILCNGQWYEVDYVLRPGEKTADSTVIEITRIWRIPH